MAERQRDVDVDVISFPRKALAQKKVAVHVVAVVEDWDMEGEESLQASAIVVDCLWDGE